MNMAGDVNRDNFEEEVFESKQPVLVDFWGPQCKPCLALMPALERIEKHYVGRLKVAKLNAAENRMVCAKLRVMGLPTFILYKDGVEMNRLVGDHITESDLLKAIETVLISKMQG
jgi:thioredoxin 1